jgi:phage repressor protein C with HTH and peptisase S24 domain
MAFGLEIKRLRDEAPISAQKLADFIGIKADRLRKWEEKDLTPRLEDVQKIEEFFGIDLEQIMNLKSIKKFLNVPYINKSKINGEETGQFLGQLNEMPIPYTQERGRKKLVSAPYMVPLVPVKAQAGYARSFNNVDYVNKLEMYPILPNVNHRGAEWRYFEVQGESMEPTLFEHDCILVSMVPPEDWKDIKHSQVYVLVIGDDVLVKIVFPIDKENWILASSNKRVKQKKISVSEVNELWQFRARSSRDLMIPKIDIKI